MKNPISKLITVLVDWDFRVQLASLWEKLLFFATIAQQCTVTAASGRN